MNVNEQMASAMAHHQAGRLPEAAALYAAILKFDERQVIARHNLGMVSLGREQFATALPLLERAYVEDGANPGWAHSLPTIGLTLFQHQLWDEALPWLERATLAHPQNAQLAAACTRARPRDYLAPEAFDPVQGRTFVRTTPRESATYVYAIDVAGTCNLRCPTCPVGNSPLGARPKGFMDVALFQKIIDKIRRDDAAPNPEIFLFNWGEPMLHPHIGDIVHIINVAGLPSHVSTNLNVEHNLREIAKANPTNLKISLSGFTPETYSVTHFKGNLPLVKSNFYRLRHYLDQYKSTTRVWVGHHIYKNNEAQIPQVAALCAELRFEHHPIAAFYQPLERLLDVAEQRMPAPAVMDLMIEHPLSYIPRMKANKKPNTDCELRFNQTAINFDGSLALCCSVYDEQNMLSANFLEHSHAEIERMKYSHPFCATCMKSGLAYQPQYARDRTH